MYDRNEIKQIIDKIIFLKKYALFDKQGYDEKAKVIELYCFCFQNKMVVHPTFRVMANNYEDECRYSSTLYII